ncbi:MAG: cyclic pyranopterin monophosphate synthase MoaC [Nitrospirota bacterium]|nr:cyclic pyranopterin monophosphate synthase MoaC [Nitrospirota bacterium]
MQKPKSSAAGKLSHIDKEGKASMVDVSSKKTTLREAVARGSVHMKKETLDLILGSGVAKGNVFETARLAGIMAAKRTFELVPLCHQLNLTSVKVDLSADRKNSRVEIESRARCEGQTGVEMEALTAVSVAALTIYDMCKAVDKAMVISDIMLMKKSGGRSGEWKR